MNFVLPDGTVFGDDDLILRPEMVRADLSCASRGSLQDWQDQVARYAVGNSRLALFLSAGFAGPSAGIHQRTERWSASVRAIADREDHGCRLSRRQSLARAGVDGAIHQWRAHGQRLGSCGGRQLGQPARAG